jgi:hypothetical protein
MRLKCHAYCDDVMRSDVLCTHLCAHSLSVFCTCIVSGLAKSNNNIWPKDTTFTRM